MHSKCFRSRIRLLLIVIITLIVSNLSAQTPIGNLQSQYEREGNRVFFSGQKADLKLQFYTPSTVRVQTSWNRSFETVGKEWMLVDNNWPKVDLIVEETEKEVRFRTDDLVVNVQKKPLKLTFLTTSGKVLNTERISRSSGGMKKKGEAVWVEKKLMPEEHFFGFGERMDFVDQRGKKVQLDVGRGTGPTHTVGAYNILKANYSPVPFFMSTRGYGIFFHTPYATHWDMGYSNANAYSFKAVNGQIDYFFMYGPEFSAILNHYTGLTGKSPLVPKFTLGLNVGTYSGGTWGYEENTSDDYVINLGKKFREKGIPADVLHLDSTWRIFGPNGHGSTTFEWRDTFDNPTGLAIF